MMDRGGGGVVHMVQGAGRVGRVGVIPFVIIDMNFLHLFRFDNSIFV